MQVVPMLQVSTCNIHEKKKISLRLYIQGITNLTNFWKSRVQQSLGTAPFIRYVESN